jgi:hypothetical protein
MSNELLGHVLVRTPDEASHDLLPAERPPHGGENHRVDPHREPLGVDEDAVAVEDDQRIRLRHEVNLALRV